jgi:peptide-methionine (R)-S-oxide reductase
MRISILFAITGLVSTASMSKAHSNNTSTTSAASCSADDPLNPVNSQTDDYWKKKLTPEQYRILRQGGTERPFSGKYYAHRENGVYKCAGCGQILFKSDTKFDSGSGWPSFWNAIDPKAVTLVPDRSHGMERIEVRCANCGGHLGHVFDDGPKPTGKRFCINSGALDFRTEP